MIYFDITDLLGYCRCNATLTGIQRMSVLLISEIVNQHGEDAFRLIARHPLKKKIVTFSPAYFSGTYSYDQADFCSHFELEKLASKLKLYIKNKYKSPTKITFHSTRLRILNKLTGGRTFSKRHIIISMSSMGTGSTNINPSFGDIVFIPGATWDYNEYIEYIETVSKSGVRVIQFVHDLIPIVTPEHVGDEVPERFSKWLATMCDTASLFIVNSRATQADLTTYIRATNRKEVRSVVVRLAHEFIGKLSPQRVSNCLFPRTDTLQGNRSAGVSKQECSSNVRAHVSRAARLPYVLCVGTIESRKNTWLLANVWKSIYDEMSYKTPRLIFAGKPGMHNEDFENFIFGTGCLNGYIKILERPNDDELAYLYRNCLFSVFPSYYEGWGLPIGESLWFGRPVICSMTSSMPEVGGKFADYINPHDFDEARSTLYKMINDHEYRECRARNIRHADLRTWSKVAAELWEAVQSEQSLPASIRRLDKHPEIGQ